MLGGRHRGAIIEGILNWAKNHRDFWRIETIELLKGNRGVLA